MQAKIVTQRNLIKQLKQRIDKRNEQKANSVRLAPHDGIIVYREVGWHSQKKVEVGSWVGPWSSPLDLPNYEYMKVRTQVPESVVNHLTARHGPPSPVLGSKVRVRVKTLSDRDYPAEITWVDGWARDRNANLSQADVRSEGYSGLQVFNVEVELLESDPDRLREGFRAIVDFPIQTHRNVMAIPRDAVIIRHGQAMVRVKEGGETALRPIVLGAESRDRVIVREGLREGESVFVPPTVEEQKSLSSQTRSGEEEGNGVAKKATPSGNGGTGTSQGRDSRKPAQTKPAAPSGGGRSQMKGGR
jgi:multidrug efflux pump subunit AcrA (membrane-fusion protein)